MKLQTTVTTRGRPAALSMLLLAAVALAAMPAAAQDCEVKIGAAGPMTGGGASWGLAMKAGAEFEAAWTNASGGLQVGNRKCKVNVVSVDSQSTAAGAAAAANTFASQNVHAVVGPVIGPESAGFKPVAKRSDIVSFTTTFAIDALGPEFPLAFHQVQGPAVWGPLVVKSAVDRLKLKTVVVIGPNDQGGTDSGNVLAKLYAEAGAKTSTEWYQRGTPNFAAVVTRLMSGSPDSVELGPMPPGEAGVLVKQMLEAGYNGAFGRLGAGGDVILETTGIDSQKAFYWFDHTPTMDPGVKKLNTDFDRLMKAPVPENALWYSAQMTAEMLLKAISAAGTDRSGEKIAAALRKLTPESRYVGKAGWRGKTQYGINQEFAFPVALSFIQNGKVQPQARLDVPVEN